MAHDDQAAAPVRRGEAPITFPAPGFRDRHLRRTRTRHLIWRTVVGVFGALIVALGVVLLPLPGPGWLVIFAGLAILASEFAWAERLLHYARDKVLGWTHWVAQQSRVVRLLITVGCLALVGLGVVAYLAVIGIPAWLPDELEQWLESWVP